MTFFYMSSTCCYWPGSAFFLRGEASNGFGKANMNKILRTSRRTWTFVVCRRWDPSERDAFESQSEKRNWNLQTWFANVSKVWLEQLLVRSSKGFFRCGKLGFLGGTVSCVSVISYIFREFQNCDREGRGAHPLHVLRLALLRHAAVPEQRRARPYAAARLARDTQLAKLAKLATHR